MMDRNNRDVTVFAAAVMGFLVLLSVIMYHLSHLMFCLAARSAFEGMGSLLSVVLIAVSALLGFTGALLVNRFTDRINAAKYMLLSAVGYCLILLVGFFVTYIDLFGGTGSFHHVLFCFPQLLAASLMLPGMIAHFVLLFCMKRKDAAAG